MDKQKFSKDDIKAGMKELVEKIKDKNTSKEERLGYLELLSSLVEFNIAFLKEIKKRK